MRHFLCRWTRECRPTVREICVVAGRSRQQPKMQVLAVRAAVAAVRVVVVVMPLSKRCRDGWRERKIYRRSSYWGW